MLDFATCIKVRAITPSQTTPINQMGLNRTHGTQSHTDASILWLRVARSGLNSSCVIAGGGGLTSFWSIE